MNIYFKLADTSKPKTSIRMIVSHKGKKFVHSVGISIDTKTWNQTKQKCSHIPTQQKLKQISHFAEDTLSDFSSFEDIEKCLSCIVKGEVVEKKSKSEHTFHEVAELWIKEREKNQSNRRRLIVMLESVTGDFDFEDVNVEFLTNLHAKMNKKGLACNTISLLISKLKTIMRKGLKLKYHENRDFEEYKTPSMVTVDTIYLTEEELQKLQNVQTDSETEQKVKDLFFLGYYSGARWSDYSEFSVDNIEGNNLRYIQRKTAERITIPLSPKITEILSRNNGKAPKLCQQTFNLLIKSLCSKAGINQMVEIRKSVGSGYRIDKLPKYMLVSSHTCRRTLCTILAKRGIPINQIMHISGHKNLSNLQRYLRQTADDTNDMLRNLDIFK